MDTKWLAYWLGKVIPDNNFSRPFIFRKSILQLKQQIEELKPDKVVNFYEMITGMAYGIYRFDKKMGVEMISVAHHYVLMNPNY